jgi:hypothetical protein
MESKDGLTVIGLQEIKVGGNYTRSTSFIVGVLMPFADTFVRVEAWNVTE